MRNIYPDLMIKMLSGIKKSFFPQISAVCIGVCAYMHTTFLVGEIADRFVGQAQYTGNISSLTKNTLCDKAYFFAYFRRKCGFASIII